MKTHACLAALLAAGLSCGALAQETLKPGLWQVQTRMPGDPEFDKAMAEMGEALASMSPQERRQMEAAMGRQGVQMAAGGKGGPVTRFCMSKEQAQRQEVGSAQGDCKVTRQSRSGRTLTSSFTCTRPKSSGESVVTFRSAEAYASKLTMVSEEGGRKEKTVMESEARWLAADCGAIQPIGSVTR